MIPSDIGFNMKTAEEIFQECADNSFVFATQTQAIKAMKLYANAKLDEAKDVAYECVVNGKGGHVVGRILQLKDPV